MLQGPILDTFVVFEGFRDQIQVTFVVSEALRGKILDTFIDSGGSDAISPIKI